MGPLIPLFWTYVLQKFKKKKECIAVGCRWVCLLGVSAQGVYTPCDQRQTPQDQRQTHPFAQCMLGYTPPDKCIRGYTPRGQNS